VVWLIADLVWLTEVIAAAEMWQLCFLLLNRKLKKIKFRLEKRFDP